MKSLIFSVFLLTSSPVIAQAITDQTGVGGLTYRNGDPFVFCRYGQKNLDRCWWPTPNYTGNFAINPACVPPSEYGKDWSDDDWNSLGQYLRICPRALDSGTWQSQQGDGTNVPSSH